MTYRRILPFVFLTLVASTGAIAQEAEPKSSTPQDSSTASVPQEKKLEVVRVGGNVAKANLIHQVQPEYPVDAKQAHIQGTVVLHVIIGRDGKIEDVQYISGPPLLKKSAMDAVKQWVYKRTLLNGEPVKVDTTIAVVFTLGR